MKKSISKRSEPLRRADREVTEATVLALLERHPSRSYSYTMLARQLGCTTARCIELLDTLAKRQAVRMGMDSIGQTLFSARVEDKSSGLQRIRERGDLRSDYNGALRHWELSMVTRRS